MRKPLAIALLIAAFAGLFVAWSAGRWAITVAQAGILGVAIVWTFAWMRGSAATPSRATLPIAALALWGAAQLYIGATVYRWQTEEAVLYWVTNFAAFAVSSSLAAETEVRRLLLRWYFRVGATIALVAVLQVFTSPGKAFWVFQTIYQDGVFGPFLYKNQYAAFIELLLPVSLTVVLAAPRLKWWAIVVTAALLSCAVASLSRAGLIGAIAEVIAVSAILLARRRITAARAGTALATLLVVGTAFVLIVGPQSALARLQEHDPYSNRRDMAVASITMFREKSLTGFGLGTWPTAYPHYANDDDGLIANQAHNDWAQIADEAGIAGLGCYLVLFAWAAKTAWQKPWAIGLAVILLHALVDYPIQRQALGVAYFLLAGVASRSGDGVRDTAHL